jgi:parallel beta-helix repeat protein
MYYLMLPPSLPPSPLPIPQPSPLPPSPLQLTPHGAIAIDGDANFSDTALLEGWPGDGSPENPFIIDGLDIDLGGGFGSCIAISNTRVSFTISNCNLTGAGGRGAWPVSTEAGIYLENVTNGELVNNICSSNGRGINLIESDSNTVVNNNCSSNHWPGINLGSSHSNTVVNNTCNSNGCGISLRESDSNTVENNTCTSNTHQGIHLGNSNSNTVANNTCNNNGWGISLRESDSNTVASNTCNNNRIGIYLLDSGSNTVENNTCLGNTEYDIVEESYEGEFAAKEYMAKQFVWFLAGCGMILVVSVVAFVQFRRMEMHENITL